MLANKNGPAGFRLFQQPQESHAVTRSRTVKATHNETLAVGDAYTLDADGEIDERAAGSDTVRGIVMGFEIEPTAGAPQGPMSKDFLPTLTAGKAIVCEDPRAVFVVQATTFAKANSVQKAGLDDNAGDANLRQSRQQIDGATYGSGTQFQVLGLAPSPADNDYGAFAKILVRLATTL